MKTKEIKGITLISLAVTIVVLLILAGISINTVIGDNGIIKKAQSSAELTKESEAKEIINRTIMEFYLTNEYETLEDFLNTKVSEGRIDKVEKNADGTLKVWKNDYSVRGFDNRIVLSADKLYEKFGKENGEKVLKPYFKSIDWKEYSDWLEIQEGEPLIAYILSCHGNQNQYILNRYNEFRDYVKEKVKKNFFVTKEAGIFVCKK